MKDTPTQSDMRENTASPRRHASRPAMKCSLRLLDPLHSPESTDRSAQELRLSTRETCKLSLADPAKGAPGEGENATTAPSNSRRNLDSPGVPTSRLTASSFASVQRIHEPADTDGASSSSLSARLNCTELSSNKAYAAKRDCLNASSSLLSRVVEEIEVKPSAVRRIPSLTIPEARSPQDNSCEQSESKRRQTPAIQGIGCERIRSRGKWSVSPLWEAKILLGVLREQGLAGKGLVQAFEKWVPRVIGCSRSGIERVYYEQTGRELSDYILLQQADKTVRYNQLPPEAEIVRAAVRIPGAICYEQPSEFTRMRQQTEELLVPRQLGLDKLDPNVLLSTVEVANLTGFRPKTIRRWVSRKFLNYIRVGNRIRFRRSAVELFLAQREVRK